MSRPLILPANASEREISIRRRIHRVAEFYRHVFVYLAVIGLIWCVNLWTVWNGSLPGRWWSYWAIWPTFGWGIGLVVHGLSVLPFAGIFSQDWEEKKVKQLLAEDEPQGSK